MFKPKTGLELFYAMQTRAHVEVQGIRGVVNSLQAEDGSGRCWNATIVNSSVVSGEIRVQKETVFVREG